MSFGIAIKVEVHPRVGGGAKVWQLGRQRDMGPSPRGRGSHLAAVPCPSRSGSIPAWAGEPVEHGPVPFEHEVHPRVGGGAIPSDPVEAIAYGPSPRGRGSLFDVTLHCHSPGSIPAWAGEPLAIF